MFIGDGAKLVRDAFALAKEKSPCIIFIDEIDAIGTKRFDSEVSGDREVQRTMLELLNQLDGFSSDASIKVLSLLLQTTMRDETGPWLSPIRHQQAWKMWLYRLWISKFGTGCPMRASCLYLYLEGLSLSLTDLLVSKVRAQRCLLCVQVIAATNRADILDPALMRSGRLDRKIEFPHPTEDARAKILQIHSRKMNVSPDVNFEELARSSDDFNAAQLKAVSPLACQKTFSCISLDQSRFPRP